MLSKKPLLVAMACALLIAVLSWFYLNSLEQKYRDESSPVPVLVARSYIAQGTVLKDRMLQVAKVPRQYIQPGAITSMSELAGEDGKNIFITLLPVLENEQVTMSKLSNIKNELGLAIVIPEGKTAVPLKADEITTLGGLIRPGNRVNVLCTFDYDDRGKQTSMTTPLFQNVEVLSVGTKIVGAKWQQEERKEQPAAAEGESKVTVITLALAPEEESLMTFAREKGSITLALRSAGDDANQGIPATKLENMLPGSANRTAAMNRMEALRFIEQLQNR
jgi:pilus assembly protein CpaB